MDGLCNKLQEIFSQEYTKNQVVEDTLNALNAYKSKEYDWDKYAIFDTHSYTDEADRAVWDASTTVREVLKPGRQRMKLEDIKSNPGVQSRYTRNLVDSGNGKFNVMILCWGPNMRSSIHDHTKAHCFVKVLCGKLKEIQYGWPKEGELEEMKSSQEMFFPRDGVTYINDVIGLHRMENPSHTDIAVTLHVYIPPFDICQTFDQHTGQSKHARMSFWSKYGEKISAQNLNEMAACSSSTESLN